MVMLPDYPDRVIAENQKRLDRISLTFTLVLVSAGAWWLIGSLTSDSDPLIRFGPVAILFSSALLVTDLVRFGPSERSRVATGCNILWTPLLAFTEYHRESGADVFPLIIQFSVVLVLFWFSRQTLGGSLKSRRWRGLTTLPGIGIAIPIISSITNPFSWVIVIFPALIIAALDLSTRDELHEDRQAFSSRLRKSESILLRFQSDFPGMQQSSSLIKSAREVGWKDPKRGLHLISQAELEVERLVAIRDDLKEIKFDSKQAIDDLEKITGISGGPRKIFDLALEEEETGSFREAEKLFRLAKSNSKEIGEHWLSAMKAIDIAEKNIGDESGHLVDELRSSISEAKKLMGEEKPKNALSIAESIPERMSRISLLLEEASQSVDEAEKSIGGLDFEVPDSISQKITQAKDAIERGDAPLAKGLADSINREFRITNESTQMVRRALRQRSLMEERFPSGDSSLKWKERLDNIASLAADEEWPEAAEILSRLTFDLEKYDSERKESLEMLQFLQKDWYSLRKKLDSSKIPTNEENRVEAEKSLSKAEEDLESGDLQSFIINIEIADLAMETLRRLV